MHANAAERTLVPDMLKDIEVGRAVVPYDSAADTPEEICTLSSLPALSCRNWTGPEPVATFFTAPARL